MFELKRLTTQFIEAEDRIRLTGEIDQSHTVSLWLTQRLINRLLPHVFVWLETHTVSQTRPEILQSFAQQAARSSLTAQPPVPVAPQVDSWLVASIDLKKTPESLQLVFKGDKEEQRVCITLQTVPLRQWLNIICEQYRSANWALDYWPDWMKDDVSLDPARTAMRLH